MITSVSRRDQRSNKSIVFSREYLVRILESEVLRPESYVLLLVSCLLYNPIQKREIKFVIQILGFICIKIYFSYQIIQNATRLF